MVDLKPAVCPICSGDLRVPENKKTVICMYCGKQILVVEAIDKASGPKISNYLEIANHAKQAGNYKEAYDYFTKVLELSPTNYEAWLGKGESAGWLSTLADFRIPEMVTGIRNAVKFCPEEKSKEIKAKGADMLNNIAVAFWKLTSENVYKFGSLADSQSKFYERCVAIIGALELAYDFNPSNQILDNLIFILQAQIEGVYYKDFDPDVGDVTKVLRVTPKYEATLRQVRDKYVDERKSREPTYQPPEIKKKSRCFIVTATMGDTNHPNVILLRTFRDQWLSNRVVGKLFINEYYKYSPRIAQLIRNKSQLKRMSYAILVKPSVILAKKLLRTKI